MMALFKCSEFEEFINFCKIRLGAEDEIIALLNKRYNKCNEHYLRSPAFTDLLFEVKQTILSEPDRTYVHIQKLSTELKAYKRTGKRKEISSESEMPESKRQCTSAEQPSIRHDVTLSRKSVKTDAESGPRREKSPEVEIMNIEDGDSETVCSPAQNPSSLESEHSNDNVSDHAAKETKNGDIPSLVQAPVPSTSCKDKEEEKLQRKIQRLENLLEKFSKEIKRLEETEISIEEMGNEDTNYILVGRYKDKSMKIWKKICEYTGRTTKTDRPTQKTFRYEGSRYPELNQKISKFVNKTGDFPDYQDIRDIIIHVNKKHLLKLGKRAIDDLARQTFTEVGNLLQRRRIDDQTSNASCHLTEKLKVDRDDPAIYDRELRRKLEKNRELSKNNIEEVIRKYSELQDTTKEGSESDEEDEDEDVKECSGDNKDEDTYDGIHSIELPSGGSDVEEGTSTGGGNPGQAHVEDKAVCSNGGHANSASNETKGELRPHVGKDVLPSSEALKDPKRLRLPKEAKKMLQKKVAGLKDISHLLSSKSAIHQESSNDANSAETTGKCESDSSTTSTGSSEEEVELVDLDVPSTSTSTNKVNGRVGTDTTPPSEVITIKSSQSSEPDNSAIFKQNNSQSSQDSEVSVRVVESESSQSLDESRNCGISPRCDSHLPRNSISVDGEQGTRNNTDRGTDCKCSKPISQTRIPCIVLSDSE